MIPPAAAMRVSRREVYQSIQDADRGGAMLDFRMRSAGKVMRMNLSILQIGTLFFGHWRGDPGIYRCDSGQSLFRFDGRFGRDNCRAVHRSDLTLSASGANSRAQGSRWKTGAQDRSARAEATRPARRWVEEVLTDEQPRFSFSSQCSFLVLHFDSDQSSYISLPYHVIFPFLLSFSNSFVSLL